MASTASATRRTQAERSGSTRRALMEATYASILETGYHSTTTRRVAEMSGVSLGAVHHHFPTRIELVTATLDDAGARALTNVTAKIEAFEGTHHERAHFALDLLWEMFGGDLFLVWIKVWFAADEDPDLLAAMQPVEKRMSALIAVMSEQITPGSVGTTQSRNKIRYALATMRGLGLSRVLAQNHATAVVSWETAREELLATLRI